MIGKTHRLARHPVKIVLHAGFPKTGSSTLQHYLASHRSALRENGILYPKFDGYDSHWVLTAAFHDFPGNYHHVRRRMAKQDVSRRLNAAKGELHALLAGTTGDEVVLLSHEGFGGDLQATQGIVALRDMLLDFSDHVQILAYARNPVELYPSSLQQRLKNMEKRVLPPGDWISDHPARADYLRRVFGEERCNIRVYSSSTLLNGDVIDDFARYLFRTTGKRLPLSLHRERRNSSLSAQACAILFALKSGHADNLDRKVFVPLRKLLTMYDAARVDPKLEIPKAWIGIIAARQAGAWNRLVNKASCFPVAKAPHKLPRVADPPTLSPDEFRAWLLGHGSRTYTAAFADFCERQEGRSVRIVAETLRGLASHFPDTETSRAA